MRQADYDRAMNEGKAELAKSQSDLAAANERLNTEIAEWGRVQNEGGEATRKMRSEMEKAQAEVLRLQQTVQRVAADHGLDATALLGSTPPAPPPAPAHNFDEQFQAVNTQLGSLADAMLTLPAELQQIATEHQALYGEHVDPRTIVRELKTRAGTRGNQKSLNPREIWEEMYKVADKRAEVAKATHDKAIADAREEGRQAGLSEAAIPGHHSPGPNYSHSPLFNRDRASILKRPQPQQAVNRAVAAFASGKYRQPAGKQPA